MAQNNEQTNDVALENAGSVSSDLESKFERKETPAQSPDGALRKGDADEPVSQTRSLPGGQSDNNSRGTEKGRVEYRNCDPSHASKRLKDWSPLSKVGSGHEKPGGGRMIGYESSRLLRELAEWTEMRTRISETYVRLGSYCNDAVAVFGCSESDTSEFHTAPKELRVILENCLAADALPEDAAPHLPTVNKIRQNLLDSLQQRLKDEASDEESDEGPDWRFFEPPANQINGGRPVYQVKGNPRPKPRP
ncbi:hypothetical protein ONZ45_g8200 [Pleurotus djamor]|nr:hypothetical protein ONZ45_g8200 [Pleurotus djamor]